MADTSPERSAELNREEGVDFNKEICDWCCEPGREYMSKKLSLNVKVNSKDVEHYEYFEQHDMELIVNNLDTVKKAWHFWVILIAMYTGTRAGEISS